MRSQTVNVPMEMIRSVVAVAETGSISKAAERLGLSQPAVSAQIKRLQILVGGELFVRTANGTTLTELGQLALKQARRMIETNDQLLRLGGYDHVAKCRFGITQILAPAFFEHFGSQAATDVFLVIEQSSLIRKGLIDGYIDMALLFLPQISEVDAFVITEKRCDVSWIRSRDFVTRPGAPLPLISLPDDEWQIRPLEQQGVSYRIALRSSDHSVRMNAVRAGIGLMGMPNGYIPQDLVKTKDYYLPELAPMKMALCARPDMDSRDKVRLSKQITSAFFEANAAEQAPDSQAPA